MLFADRQLLPTVISVIKQQAEQKMSEYVSENSRAVPLVKLITGVCQEVAIKAFAGSACKIHLNRLTL